MNRLAVPIIALEIVRRNLSGNILIDFIGYKKREELRDYIPIFKEYLSQSHVSYSIAGRSPLGNFEIRRSRHRACLLDVLSSPAALAYRFFREICRSKTPIKQATVGPVLYKALNTQLAEDWEMAQKRNGQDIKLTVDPEMKEYQI